jgi:two-component system, LytTR family, sensor kinase
MTITKRHTTSTVLTHLAFWALYVLSEYLANRMHVRDSERSRWLWTTLLSLPLLMIPTYVIALYTVPKYLMQRKFLHFVFFIIAAIAFVLFGRVKWLELTNYIINQEYVTMPIGKVQKNVIRDYSVIALAVCIYIIGDWRKKEKETKQLMEAKAKSDLEFLKQQLHPHFLFNTLNNIYSLALKNLEPENQTVKSILRLSRLMEYLVYQSGEDKVFIKQELELIKHYVDLETLRYGSALDVQLDLDDVDETVQMTPLVLLPFVENCFKHGGKNEKGIFWIKIKVRVFEKKMIVSVSNSNPVKKKKTNGGGVGLKNIKRRLDLIYPKMHTLTIEDSNEFYAVNLELDNL